MLYRTVAKIITGGAKNSSFAAHSAPAMISQEKMGKMRV
jgi:hypothetical protein